MADQYRNVELQRMFQDLGRALEENQANQRGGRPAVHDSFTAAGNPYLPETATNRNMAHTGRMDDPEVYQSDGGPRDGAWAPPSARANYDWDRARELTQRLSAQEAAGKGTQLPPMTVSAGAPRRAMTPEEQALAHQVDQIPGQVAAGLGGAGGPRRPMTPGEQALAAQLDQIPRQVAAGLQGGGPAQLPQVAQVPQMGAGVSPEQLDALERQATAGLSSPAQLPQIQPVDTAGLDAYARMRGAY